jgi:uncharacterized protein YbjQ (UPF0145 family)
VPAEAEALDADAVVGVRVVTAEATEADDGARA